MKGFGHTALLALCFFSAAATSAAPSGQSPVVQAQAQLNAGDAADALHTLDAYLASAPANPEARFLRGVVLARLNRPAEAIEVFRILTADNPKLPEPYNNLAVLYAQRGDLVLARDTLEAGLVQQPEYAPAHENLGDVYAALAAKAYSHALILAPDNVNVKYKLSLVSQIGGGASGIPAAH